jgi:ribonuclease P protein component
VKIGKFSPLRLNKDFQEIKKYGSYSKSENFLLKSIPSKESKIAFSIRKKIANSPMRNKLKRRIREIVRNQINPQIPIYCIVIARNEASKISFSNLELEIKSLFLNIKKEKKIHFLKKLPDQPK